MDNIYTDDIQVEEMMPVSEAIVKMSYDLEKIKNNVEMHQVEKESVISCIQSWLETIKDYAHNEYFSCFNKEEMCYCVIDQQGDIIDSQL